MGQANLGQLIKKKGTNNKREDMNADAVMI